MGDHTGPAWFARDMGYGAPDRPGAMWATAIVYSATAIEAHAFVARRGKRGYARGTDNGGPLSPIPAAAATRMSAVDRAELREQGGKGSKSSTNTSW